MSEDTNLVKVHILEKEYVVACPEGEKEELRASAAHLNTKMREIRDSGKVIGSDRISVMAALNIAHDLIQANSREPQHSPIISARIRALQVKIDTALEQTRQFEL